jgi:hypothetical protein
MHAASEMNGLHEPPGTVQGIPYIASQSLESKIVSAHKPLTLDDMHKAWSPMAGLGEYTGHVSSQIWPHPGRSGM